MKKTSKRTAASRAPSRRPRRAPRRTGIAPKAAKPLLAFAALARREKLRWYLFGAQAVAAHGVPRSTDDIDVTVWLGERNLAEIVAPLRRAGFRPRIDDLAFAMETRVFPVHHVPTGWNLDIVLAGPGIEMSFLAEVVQQRVGTGTIPLIAAEHLAGLKILAGRPKDLEDVRGLLRIEALEHPRVLETLKHLEAALDQSDLIPLYQRLRRELKR